METLKKKMLLESLLFVSGEPVTVAGLSKVMDTSEQEVRLFINELSLEYRDRNSGIIIAEIADGYQMLTNPDSSAWVKKLKNVNHSSKLSQPALETLAIIAYKQPITKIEVDQLRGLNSDSAVKSLMDKRLIRIIGKKESPGRPFLYATTREFLQYFGLNGLSELPPINNFLRDEAA